LSRGRHLVDARVVQKTDRWGALIPSMKNRERAG
jgi:hypothetical protein